jgi:nucleotide-binding universal stress UspA family protein
MRGFRRPRAMSFETITAQLVDIPWPATEEPSGPTAAEDGRPILVAIGGTGRSWAALDWAASQAAARDRTLRILNVVSLNLSFDIYGAAINSGDTAALDTADSLLELAARRARCIAPDLTITTQLRHGDPGATILDEARAAHLLVLGGPRARGRLHPRRPSLTGRIARRSSSPLAIVPAARKATDG